MLFDSDVALLGTGAASLIAAIHLLAEGKSVVLLNPDWDFFLEDSELPFDPLFSFDRKNVKGIDALRLRRSSIDLALRELRPGFPGAVESWNDVPTQGFQDHSAPFVRARSRLWANNKGLGRLEDLYVLASDAGHTPQILEGLQVSKRFPGAPFVSDSNNDGLRGLWIPKLYDVDVTRYRNGLLEFVRERSKNIVCNATQIELVPDGVRFFSQGKLHTAKIRDGLLVFWTPRLTQWVLNQARHLETTPILPKGVRLWEQWSLISRSTIHPGVIGVYGDCMVWAEIEGSPDGKSPLNHIALLRAGPLINTNLEPRETLLFNSDSFNTLETFIYNFLKWEKITIRGVKSRAIFEWNSDGSQISWSLAKNQIKAKVVMGSDGPLADVVRIAQQSCKELS